MRAVEIHAPYGIDALRLCERPVPGAPGKSQVLVRMRAASLNYRDLLVARGQGAWCPPSGRIPLSDGVGEIVEMGSEVVDLRVGDRILSSILPNWRSGPLTQAALAGSLGGSRADGVLAEYALLEAGSVVRAPEYLSDAEAATLPCAGLTAWHALQRAGSMTPGRTVLVQGTGGVSLFALQFAKAAGATVLATSSSDTKLGLAIELGATAGVNYRTSPEWDVEVMRLTNGVGVDHVIDIGGADTLARSARAAAFHGVISTVGLVGGLNVELDLFPIFSRNLSIHGIEVGSREMMLDMLRFMTQHEIRPIIDSVWPVATATEAFRRLESGGHVGKICITL